MKCSIIIPTFNAERTIQPCLKAIFNSNFKNFEVIVVDDASTDQTVFIAKEFPCRIIQLDNHGGAALARNRGQREAAGDILIFIDADVLVFSDTLEKIINSFKQEPELVAVFGTLSKSHPNKDFLSQYKNLYMHFRLKHSPCYTDFIYGSCWGIRNKYFEPYDATYKFGEDTELGLRLSKRGYKLLLNKDIEVIHLKQYSFLSFLKNDFLIPFYWSRLFISHKGWIKIFKTKRFFHAQATQLLGIILSILLLVSIFIYPHLIIFFIFCFLFSNLSFFWYLYRERKLLFTIKAFFITWIDSLIMASGIVTGFILYFPTQLLQIFLKNEDRA